MNLLDAETFKVKAAALLGLGSPIVIHFFEWSKPVLDWLLSAGQVGVAIATTLYILSKWRAVRKSRKSDSD